MKHVIQEQIAALMGGADSMEANHQDHKMNSVNGLPSDDSDGAGSNVVDGRSDMAQTQVKSCSASSCKFNVDGACSKTAITISQTGGCEDYEASSDNYDEQDAQDDETIAGISTAIPDSPEHPSALSNMVSKYMPNNRR